MQDSLGNLIDLGLSALVYIGVLTVLVLVHELGHFWFARMCGMRVDAVAVMMGGVRKTDLTPYLGEKLAKPSLLWGAAVLSVGILLTGHLLESLPVFAVGLALLVVMPVWVSFRLGMLYHLKAADIIRTFLIYWGIGMALLFFGTRFQNLDVSLVGGLLLGGSLIAMGVTYYTPVMRGSRVTSESMHGHGSIDVDGSEVAVRFRPVLARTAKSGTEWSLLLLPLGGFASIHGMHPYEDGRETKIKDGFFSKSPLKRLLVLFAGPLFSIAFGVLLMTLHNMYRGEQIDAKSALVGYVPPGAAQAAGIEAGDIIVSVDGNPVASFDELVSHVRFAYDPETFEPNRLTLEVKKTSGEVVTTTLTPTVTDEPQPVSQLGTTATASQTAPLESKRQARLGIIRGVEYEKQPFLPAFQAAVWTPVNFVQMLVAVFSDLEVAKENAGSPVDAVKQTSVQMKEGFWAIVLMAGSLSIVLGILNLLPFPPLDGGQMVVALIEMFRGGRRLSIGVQQSLNMAGMFLVASMMLVAFAFSMGRQSEANQFKQRHEQLESQQTPPDDRD